VHQFKLIIFLLITIFLSSCVFVPKESEEQKYAGNCDMLTRQLTLSAQKIDGHVCKSGSSAEACLIVYGVILPVGSFVISGSIVLIGNTLHWIEYQGPCSEDLT